MQAVPPRHSFRSMLLAALLALCCGALSAQTITGRISGTVTDATGATVPNAAVTVTNEATDLKRTATTNEEGFYVVTNLPVGRYTVTIEQQGFKRSSKTGYDLVADGRLTIDFKLETGSVNESVEIVAANGETVNSTSG